MSEPAVEGLPRIAVGIAGWSYDDWRGRVYPRGCKDTLRHCASYVDCIEINSTFYHIPVARNAESWVERVHDLPIWFSAKLPREFTHDGARDRELVAATRSGFAPLSESGRLHTLLAQFGFWFDHTPAHVAQLEFLARAFAETAPLTVEVRHASWAQPAGMAALSKLGVAVANLDYAGFDTGFSIRATGMHGVQDLGYLRLHGRSAAWFDKDAERDQVYDYDYPQEEVAGIMVRARELSEQAGRVVIVANNHFAGQAMKVALELRAAIQAESVAIPEVLATTYPTLMRIRKRPPGMLF